MYKFHRTFDRERIFKLAMRISEASDSVKFERLLDMDKNEIISFVLRNVKLIKVGDAKIMGDLIEKTLKGYEHADEVKRMELAERLIHIIKKYEHIFKVPVEYPKDKHSMKGMLDKAFPEKEEKLRAEN